MQINDSFPTQIMYQEYRMGLKTIMQLASKLSDLCPKEIPINYGLQHPLNMCVCV